MLVTLHENTVPNIKNTWFVTHILYIVTHSIFFKKIIIHKHMVFMLIRFFGNTTHYKITQTRNLNNHWKLYWLWEETIILLITWCVHNDTILERKCTYIVMEGTCCLCTIFLKRMSVLLDMLWVPLAWLQWASAPPNNATVAQLAVHWSLFSLSLHSRLPHKTTRSRRRLRAVWRPAEGALYAI